MRNMYLIETAIEDAQWDEFIIQHPYGNIFQSRYIYEVYSGTKNCHPLKLFAIDQSNGKLCGVLSAVVVCEIDGLFRNFSTHSIIQGGPLVLHGLEDTVVPLLIAEHDRLSRKKALYSEIRNLYDVKEILPGLINYEYEDHLNFLIKLDQSEEELWRQLHRTRKRSIKHALENNLIVEEINNKELLPVFYDQLKETYKHARVPLADITLFESAFKCLFPSEMIRFFLVKHKNKFIGGLTVLLFKRLVYAWYGGALREYIDLQPFSFVLWHCLKWGIANGYSLFDFGGGGKPGIKYGPRNYKAFFGGELVNYGRYKNVYSPIRMNITNIGFEVYRRLFF